MNLKHKDVTKKRSLDNNTFVGIESYCIDSVGFDLSSIFSIYRNWKNAVIEIYSVN